MGERMRASFLVLLIATCAALAEQEKAPEQVGPALARGAAEEPVSCSKLAPGDLAPLAKVCEMATSTKFRLPDFVCHQTTTRHRPPPLEGKYREDWKPLPEVINAEVQYLNGHESYSNITVNGKPASSMIQSYGMSSNGEFGTMLRSIFEPNSAAQFKFMKVDGVALVFEFRVDGNHSNWFVQVRGKPVRSAYHGRIWVEKSSGSVIRVERIADSAAPMTTVVEYADVKLGDRGTFRLPSKASLTLCVAREAGCFENTAVFTNCRKFTAKSQIIGDTGETGNGKTPTVEGSTQETKSN